MKKAILEIKKNMETAQNVWRLELNAKSFLSEPRESQGGEASGATSGTNGSNGEKNGEVSGACSGVRPGQFVNIAIAGKYLRRPLSVCNCENGVITLMYKTVGEGTQLLSQFTKGEKLDVLLPLGNGFDLDKAGKSPLLIGGGMGATPLLYLAAELKKNGASPKVLLGFGDSGQDFISKEFKRYRIKAEIATLDGSLGAKGLITEIIPQRTELVKHTFFYTCGPEAMMRAVCDKIESESLGALCGEVSFEERMGCGFGACMGCTCKTKYGSKRICKDGPVLSAAEVIW